MKAWTLLSLSLLPAACICAKRMSGGIFEQYYGKFQASAPLKLDDTVYEQLTAKPRNHTTAVLLTALETRYGCQMCRDFQPEWDLLGRSWAMGDKSGHTKTLFGTLDFNDGKATFQKVW